MTDSSSGAQWDVMLNSVHGFTQGPYENAAINEWDWTAKDPTGLVSQVQMASSNNSISATTIQTETRPGGLSFWRFLAGLAAPWSILRVARRTHRGSSRQLRQLS